MNLAKVYFDTNGIMTKIVKVINEVNYDHTKHDTPGLTSVVLDIPTYDSAGLPVPMNGIAWHTGLYTICAATLLQANPVMSALLTSNNNNAQAVTASLAGSVV